MLGYSGTWLVLDIDMTRNPLSASGWCATTDTHYQVLQTGAAYADLYDQQGWLAVEGKDAASFLQGLLTAHTRSLAVGGSTEAWALDAQGKILFHVVVYRQKTVTYLLQTALLELSALQAHLDKYLIMEEAVLRPMPGLATVTVQGRGTAAVLERLTLDLEAKVSVDRCGLGGTDLVVAEAQRLELLGHLKHHLGLYPIDDLAFLATRLETFTPNYGIEMVPGENPLTYGKGGTRISYTKGCFLGQETVARSRDRGHPARLLVLIQAANPAPSEKDLSHDGHSAGTWITQAYSPSHQAFLAFALVKYAHAQIDLHLLDESNQAWRVVACSNYSSD